MKTQNQRKLLLMMPVVVMPFLSFTFWALGGGTATDVNHQRSDANNLISRLPDAHFDEKDKSLWDKLSLYRKAEQDSLKQKVAEKNDPYFRLKTLDTNTDTLPQQTKNVNPSLGEKLDGRDNTAERINQKLEDLSRIVQDSEQRPAKPDSDIRATQAPTESDEEIRRLEAIMSSLQQNATTDSEMEQIDGVLEKILDIQHPERLKHRYRSQDESSDRFTFQAKPYSNDLAVTDLAATLPSIALDSIRDATDFLALNGFFGIDDPGDKPHTANSFKAAIYEDQKITSGSVVKLLTLEPITIGIENIPQGKLIFGVASINEQRLQILIRTITNHNSVLPVDLTVYDLDGLEGIYAPGAVERDAAKQSTNQALQELDILSLNPSIGAQAANAGIQTTKSILGRKTKAISVTVKSGHQVLLFNKTKNPSNQ
jgi:conjugative transposon TraM protein